MTTAEKGFTTVEIKTPEGPIQIIAERTSSPHLVINPAHNAETEQGFQGFGFWLITHVPTGYAIPTKYEHDLETVRWMARSLAESDVDWAGTPEEIAVAAGPLVQKMIEQADEEDVANTPFDQIPRSTLRKMCAANARLVDAKAGEQS